MDNLKFLFQLEHMGCSCYPLRFPVKAGESVRLATRGRWWKCTSIKTSIKYSLTNDEEIPTIALHSLLNLSKWVIIQSEEDPKPPRNLGKHSNRKKTAHYISFRENGSSPTETSDAGGVK